MDSEIRDAIVDDAGDISAFVSSLAAEHIAPFLGKGGLDILLASMDLTSTQERILAGWPHLCAFDGDQLLGVLVVKPPSHLYHLFIHSELHRCGLGTKLFTVADSRSRLATVNSSLNSIGAYERIGFTVDGAVVDADGVRSQPMVRHKGV